LDALVADIQAKTRQYAKRQISFFRHQINNQVICESLDQEVSFYIQEFQKKAL
jgi:tRNA A37 N6-isopentenylltransferase MiaA